MEKEENAEFMLIHMKEAFKNGVQSTVNEAKLFFKDWGFNVEKNQGSNRNMAWFRRYFITYRADKRIKQ